MMALISLWIAGLLIKNVCCYLGIVILKICSKIGPFGAKLGSFTLD